MSEADAEGVRVSCCSELSDALARILERIADALRDEETQRDYLLVAGWHE